MYSELSIAREVATITGVWRRLKGRQRGGGGFLVDEGRFRGSLLALGSCRLLRPAVRPM